MRTILALAVLPLLATACGSEYGFATKPDEVDLPADTDVALPITDTDTAEPPVETDTAPEEPVDEEGPVAADPIYAHTSDTLFTVDPVTGAATEIGAFRLDGRTVSGMLDIAVDADGRMFGGTQPIADGVGQKIYRVDPSNAELTLVCDTDVIMHAMTFDSYGLLYVSGWETMALVDVDAGCRKIATYTTAETTAGDLVGLPDGRLYWTVRGGYGESDVLMSFDPSDPLAPTRIGTLSVSRTYGLAYDNDAGTLYGFTADGDVVSIDPLTARTSSLRTAMPSWWGATTNPVVW